MIKEMNVAMKSVLLRNLYKKKERTKHSPCHWRRFEGKQAKQRLMFVFLLCSIVSNTSVPIIIGRALLSY